MATPEEQEILAKYVGWGGLANAFDAFLECYLTLCKEVPCMG